MINGASNAPGEDAAIFVQWLDTPRDWACLGGKAGPLAKLLAAGLPVPPGFVVAPQAFRERPVPDVSVATDLLLPDAVAEIRRAYRELARRLGVAQPHVAVRSSAAAEDLAGASFAGQYETYLHVQGEDEVLACTIRCGESLYAEHALAYRRHHEQRTGAALPTPAMAVLVQALVEAAAAGVAFTAHPTTGDNSCVLVNAGWGLAQSIVDGEVEADTYRVDRQTLAVVEQRIGRKATRTGVGPAAPREAVQEHLQQAPCLTAEQAAAVARLALGAEAVVGGPADVEWARVAETVWLLQARPITTLPALPAKTSLILAKDGPSPHVSPTTAASDPPSAGSLSEPAGPTSAFPFVWPDEQASKVHWQLRSLDQRRAEVLRPLEQDIRAVWNRTFEAAAVICGRSRYRTAWHVNGYEYSGEIANARSEADQALSRNAMEQVGAALAERGESYRPTVQFPPIDAGNARLAAVDVAALSPSGLAGHLDDALQWYERLWTEHWTAPQDSPMRRFLQLYRQQFGGPVDGSAAPSAGTTEAPSELALEEEARSLLTYEPNLLTEAVDALIELARIVQKHTALQELFRSHTSAAALEALHQTTGGDALRAQLDRLLQRQGLRSGAGFGTERSQVLPGWREQPALVLELMQKYVPQDLDGLLRARRMAATERDWRVAELLARLPDESTRAAFIFWLSAARQQQQAFEDHNYKIDSASSALLHRAIAACARCLVTAGVLAAPDEVWWLQGHEIMLALRGLADEAPVASTRRGELTAPVVAEGVAAGWSHWPALIAARKAQYAWRRLLTPPPALGAPSPDPPPSSDANATPTPPLLAAGAAPTDETGLPPHLLVKGKPGSRGVATGHVRLVSHEALVPDVAAGDVLVAHNAGLLWTPVFPMVAAVVLDQGDLFQHAMLTCREYGVPAVFQTKDGTQRLQEGQGVTVDGTHGWVLATDGAESAPPELAETSV